MKSLWKSLSHHCGRILTYSSDSSDFLISDIPKVAFSAGSGYNGNYGPFNMDVIMVFSRVITNIGNAYSPNTGTSIWTYGFGAFIYCPFVKMHCVSINSFIYLQEFLEHQWKASTTSHSPSLGLARHTILGRNFLRMNNCIFKCMIYLKDITSL